ncbi:DUF354 domain-containing protein [Candidatus Oleimmundimicrobium sp.]|uniref:DUF354 domain-containing protein n=1 Tax=Candidatus Oleimmundimicrobium sp. TaxID=3060597 RepID=UPI00271CC28A|nr:DUF354 domain-containing protein [Candidatus Oleimmundimicrobium sp.]MDO8885565.1 DUF354 domain-containing protein [Candidatus Oleimmundimicrobium sp.]
MNIWIDITNSPHVVIFKPIIEELNKRGHSVTITAREFAQTVPMLEMHKMDYTLIGHHRGKSFLKKAVGLLSRTKDLIKFAKGKNFDLALSHGSNDLAVASLFLRIPHVTMFDYEYAKVAHNINLRVSKKALFPDLIPLDVLRPYGLKPERAFPYPGLKEEYYLYGFKPNKAVLSQLGVDEKKIIVTFRTPPDVALYHRFENPLFDDTLNYLSQQSNVCTVILPRMEEQRLRLKELNLNNIIVADKVVDAQSLIYFSDAVISAGGTINREAVVLGTPVYTIFAGKMGAIDSHLIKVGKLRKLIRPEEIELKKKDVYPELNLRQPEILVDKILHRG